MGWESIIVQMDIVPRWRKHRKTIQEKFSPSNLGDYAGMQRRVVHTFLESLGKTPEKFRDHIKRWAAPLAGTQSGGSHRGCTIHTDSVRSFSHVPATCYTEYPSQNHIAAAMILEITYGYTVENVEDPFVHLANEAAVESLRYCAQGATICDILPIREELLPLLASQTQLNRNTQVKYWPTWMPFSFYQRHAARTRTLVEKLFAWPLELVQQRIVPLFLQNSLPLRFIRFAGEWDRRAVFGSRPFGGGPRGPKGSRRNPRPRGCKTHLWRIIWRYVRDAFQCSSPVSLIVALDSYYPNLGGSDTVSDLAAPESNRALYLRIDSWY